MIPSHSGFFNHFRRKDGHKRKKTAENPAESPESSAFWTDAISGCGASAAIRRPTGKKTGA
jgi:hypothetical protein